MMDKLLHVNTKKQIKESDLLKIIPPAGFLDMIALEKNAELIITDSGGVQKEAYFFEKPCIILRPQTEWLEIVETKSAIITDTNSEKILKATDYFLNNKDLNFPPFLEMVMLLYLLPKKFFHNFHDYHIFTQSRF